MAWSPNGQRLASGVSDGSIIIWNTDDGQALTKLEGHSSSVNSVAWSPDGRYLASGSFDNSIIIWDTDNGKALTKLKGHSESVRSVAWSPDGRRLASGSLDNSIIIWDTDNRQVLTILESPHWFGAANIAWSPNGHHLASEGDIRVVIWDIDKGQILTILTAVYSNGVSGVAWSPDGHRLASGSAKGSIIIWDVNSGQVLTTLKGHSDWVNSVAWSPDGRYLASGSKDRTIQVVPEGFADHPCNWLITNPSVQEWVIYRGGAMYQSTCENLPSPPLPSPQPSDLVNLLTKGGRYHGWSLFLLTPKGWWILTGGIVAFLVVQTLVLWGGFTVTRWGWRWWRQRPTSS